MMANDAPANIDALKAKRTKPLVLIAEHEAVVAEDFAACIEGCGNYEALRAFSPEMAESLAMKHLPDLLIVADALGGEQKAIDTAVKIKSLLRIPVIMALESTHPKKLYHIEHTVNPLGVIRKPVDEAMLLDSVACALRGERNAYAKALFHHLSI